MLNEQKIKNINERIKGNKSSVPNSLFKYRPFDEFTYDMLENEYLYLCPAKRLDDPSECSVSIDLQDYYDAHTNQLTKRCVNFAGRCPVTHTVFITRSYHKRLY